MIIYKNKILEDLPKNGFKVLFIPEYEKYIIPSSIKEYNPSDNRYFCEIKGKDITDRINNFESNLHDLNIIKTIIDKIEETTFKFSYNIKYILIFSS